MIQNENVTIFQNDEVGTLGTIMKNDEPFFIGKDIAKCLGYCNTAKAIRDHVESEDKLTEQIVLAGQRRNVILINESGLYCLILGSKIHKAKAFKYWVTREVLPSIRKRGLYATEDLLTNPDMAIAVFTALKEEREKAKYLEEVIFSQNKQIQEMQPRIAYQNLVLESKNTFSITLMAKDYGWSAKRMNDYLHQKGVQYKRSGTWVLYQKYANEGYTQSETYTYRDKKGIDHSRIHLLWTQKGRHFIYNILKKEAIFPRIEVDADGI